jgi:hypothetical protein
MTERAYSTKPNYCHGTNFTNEYNQEEEQQKLTSYRTLKFASNPTNTVVENTVLECERVKRLAWAGSEWPFAMREGEGIGMAPERNWPDVVDLECGDSSWRAEGLNIMRRERAATLVVVADDGGLVSGFRMWPRERIPWQCTHDAHIHIRRGERSFIRPPLIRRLCWRVHSEHETATFSC